MHLPGVGVSETTDLQVDDYQTSQPPVKEQQVHPVPLVTDAQTPLAAHEAEVTAQFQEEGLQVANERLFQIAFGVLVLEVEKLQDERVFDLFLGEDAIFVTGLLPFRQHGGLVLRQGGALVELGIDLPVELTNGPASSQGLGFIEFTGANVLD